jgi:hypothetical protein
MISVIQTHDPLRFNIAFDRGPIEGSITAVETDGISIWEGVDLAGSVKGRDHNPVNAGKMVIAEFSAKMQDHLTHAIADLERAFANDTRPLTRHPKEKRLAYLRLELAALLA